MYVSDVELDELRTKHGRVVLVRTEAGDFVFRKPTRSELNRHVESLGDLMKLETADKLSRVLIVQPTAAELDRAIEDSPMLPFAFIEGLTQVAGFTRASEVKK